MHELLQRQLERYIGSVETISEEWQSFIDVVDEAYHQADIDRTLLERSLDLPSQELLESNRRLEQRLRTEQERTRLVEEQSLALLDVVQSVALGNLDVEVKIPEGVEVLSELAVAIEMMIDDIREMLAEQERDRAEAEEAQQRLAATLERVQAVQRRYLRQEWEGYLTDAQADRGYLLSESAEGPTAEAWLPAMTAAVQQVNTVTEGDGQSSTLAIPISLYGEAIGVLGFGREAKEQWSEDEITAVEAIIEQVALALESQRLFDEEQRASFLMGLRVKELDCLNDIGRKIEETPPIPEFLQWVVERIPLAMQYPDVCLAAIEFEDQVYGTAGAVSLPCQIVQGLRIGGKLVGRMCISYIHEHDFLDEESALLGDIVRRVSGYIESRRLFEQTQQRVRELASLNKLSASIGVGMRVGELVEQVLTQLNELMEVDASYFALYDEGTERIEFVLDFVQGKFRISDELDRKLGKGRTGYIIRSRQPLLLRGNIREAYHRLGIESSDKRARAFLGVPMILGSKVIGVLAVQSYESDDAYDEYHMELLTTVAGQVAVALERTRLLEQTQARAEELAVLNEMGRALTERLDVDAVIENLYHYASRLMDTTNFYVTLYDPEKEENSVVFVIIKGEKQKPFTIPVDQGLMGYIVHNRTPVLIRENMREWLEEKGVEEVGQPAACWLGVPLMVGDQVLGVMGVQSFTTPRLYDEHHRDLLTAIASQAAITLQNAYLFEQTEAALAETKNLAEALRVSEERFALAVRGSNDGIWDWDIQNNSLYWSPRLKEILGYADDELDIDFDAFDSFLHPDDKEHTGAAIEAHLKEREGPYDVEQRLRAKSGEYCWIRARGQAVWDEDGQPLRMVGSSTDITERKQAEADRERLLAEMETLARELAVLNEMGRALTAILDMDAVVENLYHHASRLFDTTNFYVALNRPESGDVSFALAIEHGERLQWQPRRARKGLTEYLIQTREPLLIEENVAVVLEGLGIEMIGQEALSWLGVPMMIGEQVIGMIAVQSYTTPRLYDEHHRDLLTAIANQAAIAIENTRLFEQIRTRAERERTIREITDQMQQTMDMETLMRITAEELNRALGSSRVYVRLGTKADLTNPRTQGPRDGKTR